MGQAQPQPQSGLQPPSRKAALWRVSGSIRAKTGRDIQVTDIPHGGPNLIKLTPCGRTFFLRHVSDTPPSSHL
jgi:hypothetical protein